MSDVQTVPVADLEELLDAEIPCGGIGDRDFRRSCSRPALLICVGHECPSQRLDPKYAYKCLPCWQVLIAGLSMVLAERGKLFCADCRQGFTTVQSFADYRPF